jgi:hypothetical protein
MIRKIEALVEHAYIIHKNSPGRGSNFNATALKRIDPINFGQAKAPDVSPIITALLSSISKLQRGEYIYHVVTGQQHINPQQEIPIFGNTSKSSQKILNADTTISNQLPIQKYFQDGRQRCLLINFPFIRSYQIKGVVGQDGKQFLITCSPNFPKKVDLYYNEVDQNSNLKSAIEDLFSTQDQKVYEPVVFTVNINFVAETKPEALKFPVKKRWISEW